MTSLLRRGLLCLAILACFVWSLPASGPVPASKDPAAKPAAGPDLPGFRTVETAITTCISQAAPSAAALRGYLGVHVTAGPGGAPVVTELEQDSPADRAR